MDRGRRQSSSLARRRNAKTSALPFTQRPTWATAPSICAKNSRVTKPVRRALVFFSGLGFSELYLDGRKVGDYVMGPGFTTYDKRVPYLAFDVTDRFTQPGRKALAVILADGWYGNGFGHNFEKNVMWINPSCGLNLHLEHADGTETVVVSDAELEMGGGRNHPQRDRPRGH